MSDDADHLYKVAAPLTAIGMGVSIRESRAIYQEDMCKLLIDWLRHLVLGKYRIFQHIPGANLSLRTILCQELCAEWELPTTTVARSAPLTPNGDDVEMEDATDTRPSEPAGERDDVAKLDWDPAVMFEQFAAIRAEEGETRDGKKVATAGPQSLSVEIKKELEKKLRLDYFMLYDLKLWKEMRLALRELFTASLTATTEFKRIFGKCMLSSGQQNHSTWL